MQRYIRLFLLLVLGFSAALSARAWHERDLKCARICGKACNYDPARDGRNDCVADLARDNKNDRDCEQPEALIDKLPRRRIYREVVPMGYPYANYWIGEPYLAPFAGPVRYEQGRLFEFGWAY